MRFSFLLAISAWSPGGETDEEARRADPIEPIQGIERLLEVMTWPEPEPEPEVMNGWSEALLLKKDLEGLLFSICSGSL